MATEKKILYRAADTESWSDNASFAESYETAKLYQDNSGFGGKNIYKTNVEIDPDMTLDLVESDDPISVIMELIDKPHPGAIGADEWVPRVSYELRDAGIEWVRVEESYPEETITWIFVGSEDPDLNIVEG